ncbi:MAG: 2-C-methyl-D-erythritol 4-phosphate cytidylyltransferase [Candidatus Omnitrophota bacterium]|nr:2-C-methyl-D-erythritol 4-phosphate cytidylyltransferase [Candidatus Omnitrophota bacterium]
MRPRVVAIVPAAGYGKRLGARVKKPFALLGGKPLVSYALKALDDCRTIDAIIVATERSCVRRMNGVARRFKIRKLMDVIVGGKTRFESVRNCVDRVGPSFDIILIHDAARPFVDKRIVERAIRAAVKFGASIAAVPESDTIKLADRNLFVKKTLDREAIFRAQTPQAFRYSIIKKAYSANVTGNITDDASLAEGRVRVKIIEGAYKNLKITTKEDLKIAEALLCAPHLLNKIYIKS